MTRTATDAIAELEELAVLWIERHVCSQDNEQVRRAIAQVDRESRRLQKREARASKP